MANRKHKPRTLLVGDKRIWAETTLAEDVPPGPRGQPGHSKGSIVRLIAQSKVGDTILGFTYPRPSEIFFHKAEELILKSEYSKKRALKSVESKGFIKPHIHGAILDEQELFKLLEVAFSGVLALCAALEALAAELLFNTDELIIEGKKYSKSELLNKGPEFKITKMASTVTKKSNIYSSNDHKLLSTLFEQRRKIQHWNLPKPKESFSNIDEHHPIDFILNEDLLKYKEATRRTMDHYKF